MDEHLMKKIIDPTSIIQTHINKFICISLCTHVYIYNHTDKYNQLVFSVFS